jgi:hypothetical protein
MTRHGLYIRGIGRLRHKSTPPSVAPHVVFTGWNMPNKVLSWGRSSRQVGRGVQYSWTQQSHMVMTKHVWMVSLSESTKKKKAFAPAEHIINTHTWPVCLCKAPTFACHETLLHLVWGEVFGMMRFIPAVGTDNLVKIWCLTECHTPLLSPDGRSSPVFQAQNQVASCNWEGGWGFQGITERNQTLFNIMWLHWHHYQTLTDYCIHVKEIKGLSVYQLQDYTPHAIQILYQST